MATFQLNRVGPANALLSLLFGPNEACRRVALLGGVRSVRQRRAANAPQTPVDFVADATTYADRHSVILDPHSTLPYDPDELEQQFLDGGQLTRKAYALAKAKAKYRRRVMLNLNFDHIPVVDQIVLMFPGEGTQHVGMGTKVIDHAASAELFARAGELLGYDLLEVCRRGPKSKLDQCVHSQAGVFVASLAAWEKMKSEHEELIERVTAAAGFSVGEFCALVVGNVLSFEDALKVIRVRAEEMFRCCELVPSGQLTVRTTAASKLDEALREARALSGENSENGICEVAAFLYCGVKIVGGSESALDYLQRNANQYKFQVVKRLAVPGAFHTPLMRSAAARVSDTLANVEVRVPCLNVFSNLTGKAYTRSEAAIRRCIAQQICSPVKWEQIAQLLFRMRRKDDFPTYVEVGPGRQLGTILHQIGKKAYANYMNYPC